MNDAEILPIREKHDGELPGRMEVKLWLRLLTCSTIIEKRLRRRFEDQFDTTLPRFDVLAALDRSADGMTMGELSRALLVSNGNVTALVRQLEGQGLVKTTTAPEDRRSFIVALTPQGRTYFEGLAAAHRQWILNAFGGVSAADQKALFNLLAGLKQSLAADVANAARGNMEQRAEA